MPGQTYAVEPMVCAGRPDTRILDDQWTVVTRDGRRAAHTEHTIAITEDGPEILTRVSASLRRVPALDGVRALAVVAVLAFHSGYGWARGGYLGVSVFFTLSGYLITSLLLAEHQQSGRVALGGFYRRRAARLLPVSLLGLLAALLVGRGMAVTAAELRGDLLAGFGQLANWRWLQSSESYADLFAAPSPVLHYWSLSVEEQFYLLFPPLLVWAMRRSLPRLRGVLVAGVLGSWALLVVLVASGAPDAAYYATPARLGEILVGAFLACVGAPAVLGRRLPRLVPLGLPALGVLAVAVVIADGSGRWTYALWLPATALLSVLVIVGATGDGSSARWLGVPPLVWLGGISFGVYVFHWPVYLFLTPERTGLGQHGLTALRVAVTLAIAVVVQRLLELPVQRWARRPGPRARRTASVGLLASGALVAAVLVVAPRGVQPPNDLQRAVRTVLDDPVAPAVADTGPPQVAFFGDSTAAVTSLGVAQWGEPETDLLAVTGAEVSLGCGLELPGDRRWKGHISPVSEECFQAAEQWGSAMVESGARVAVIQSGAWEVADHRLPDDAEWRHLGDPALDAAYVERFLVGVDVLLAAGAERVVWLTSPTLEIGRGDLNRQAWPESDPPRRALQPARPGGGRPASAGPRRRLRRPDRPVARRPRCRPAPGRDPPDRRGRAGPGADLARPPPARRRRGPGGPWRRDPAEHGDPHRPLTPGVG